MKGKKSKEFYPPPICALNKMRLQEQKANQIHIFILNQIKTSLKTNAKFSFFDLESGRIGIYVLST